MKKLILLFTLLLFLVKAQAQLVYNISIVDSLKNKIGSIGSSAIVATPFSNYSWSTNIMTNNDVTQVAAFKDGVQVGTWTLNMSGSGSVPLSTTSITGAQTNTLIFTTPIKGGVLRTNRDASVRVLMKATTGLTLLPNISITLTYGSSSVTIANAALLASLSDKGVVLIGNIFNTGTTNSQSAYISLLQDADLPIATGGNKTSVATFTEDSTVDKNLELRVTISNTVGASGTILKFYGANVKY